MKVYLACTVRGDRGALAAARLIAEAVERLGHTVLTRHLLSDDVESREAALTERAVFERDIRWLEEADLLIAEASGSSYGVGFEVGYALGRSSTAAGDAPVLLLYEAGRRASVSRLIAGNAHPGCTTYPYKDAVDLLRFVERYLAPRPSC